MTAAASERTISTQAQHTPGPWHVGYTDNSGSDQNDGITITANDAAVVMGGKSFGVKHGVRNIHDARLIAAAPDLLATLQTLMGLSQAANGISEKNFVAAYQAAEDAIAKATGGA